VQLRIFADSKSLQRELFRTEHGGDIRRAQRKLERPVSVRRPMHVTLHSGRAKGGWSLLRHRRDIRQALAACARRTGVKVYDFANVGSHLHLLLRARRRGDFQSFLRSFSGIVARLVTGSRKGRPLGGGRFWSELAWSRVISWGREYSTLRKYIHRNRIEAALGPAARRALEQRTAQRDDHGIHNSECSGTP
jgi:REP element-mobilizing transposase RayT